MNDLGGSLDGAEASSGAAETVAEEIRANGGEAMAHGADITHLEQVYQMVEEAKAKWGWIDILVNNAGILRDKSFSKMEMRDFKKVVDIHLFGSANCTKCVWDTMREQQYGRIVFTWSSSGIFGIFGNFGQSNYGAAKAAMIGLMIVLHHEGAKHNIRVNTLAPTAATRMLEGPIAEEAVGLMDPSTVSPTVLFLVSEDAPSKIVVGAGAGRSSTIRIDESPETWGGGAGITVDDFAAKWAEISSTEDQSELDAACMQTNKFIERAALKAGIELKEEV